jgi:hypothetical protein
VFVSVTVTFVTAVALPCVTLKGTVSWNWPPVALDALLLNQAVNADSSGTVICACDSVLPLDTVKVKFPLEIPRVLE